MKIAYPIASRLLSICAPAIFRAARLPGLSPVYNSCVSAMLAIIAKLFPELGPGLEQAATDENVRMVFGFFVFHPKSVSSVTGQLAGGEEAVQVGPRKADNDEGLRRRFAVATLPEGIDAADGPRQTVAFAEKIDGARFAVISGQDAEVSGIVVCQRVADLRSGLRELFPAKFFAQIAVDHVFDVP